MRIAQVAPMYEAVPPLRYGGTERVVHELTEALVRRGHEVTLYAPGGSRTSASLVPTTSAPLREQMTREEMLEVAPQLHLRMLSDVYRLAEDFDVVHTHVEHLSFPFARMSRTPTVATMHGRLDLPTLRPVMAAYPETHLVSISRSQRLPLRDLPLHWCACVYNGIRVETFPFEEAPGSYLLFLGRIHPEKGPEAAVEVAGRSGMPLKVAAKVDPVDRAYWKDRVEPLFRRSGVEFLGEVDDREKGELFSKAYATLFPITWPEPFGLVMAESLACGTPVLATDRGSVPEIIRHGVSGFICRHSEEMARCVERVEQLDRRKCRQEAARFCVESMVRNYEVAYARALWESRRFAGDFRRAAVDLRVEQHQLDSVS